MRKRGSQSRETLRESGYKLHKRLNRDEVILEDDSGKRELWAKNDHYAGYVIVIGGQGYEFVSSARATGYSNNPRRASRSVTVEVWRSPTKSEIKFGYGSLHYRTISVRERPHGGQKFRVDGKTWTYGSRSNPRKSGWSPTAYLHRRRGGKNPSGTANDYVTRWGNGTYHLWSPYSRRYLSKRGFATMSAAEKALRAIYRKGGRGAFKGPVSGRRVLVNPGKMALAYTFRNGFAKEAQSMYGWLLYEGLHPRWGAGRDKRGWHTDKIMIPRSELPRLLGMKKAQPSRYGWPARDRRLARNPRRYRKSSKRRGRAYRRVKFN